MIIQSDNVNTVNEPDTLTFITTTTVTVLRCYPSVLGPEFQTSNHYLKSAKHSVIFINTS